MKRINFLRKKTSIIVLLLITNFFILHKSYAQGPKSPEAAMFEPVDAPDMVNLLSGDLSYVLPILNIPSPEGGYPLALSYHAGIAMEQEATWVGLGWNINPGAIDRTVSGYPDDWKEGKKASLIFDAGGVYKSYSLGVSQLTSGVGINFSLSSHKAYGGETEYRFDVDASYSYSAGSGIGFNASLGTSGMGVGVGYKFDNKSILGINGNVSFNGGYNLGISYLDSYSEGSAVKLGNSIGINFSSKNGMSYSGGHLVRINSSTGSGSSKMNISTKNISLMIPIAATSFVVNLGFSKTKYWYFDKSELKSIGSLYAGHLNDFQNDPITYTTVSDSYESTYELDSKSQFEKPNPSFIAYDNYSVTGQGIGGAISPNIYESGSLRPVNQSVNEGTVSYEYGSDFSKQLNDSNSDDIYFNFSNENSSYLRVTSGNWATPSSSLSNITDLQTTNNQLISSVDIDGTTFDNYNTAQKRKTTGSFIEVFTNQEILNSPSIILEAKNLNRTTVLNSNLITDFSDGIGAYKITAQDGKTYHYSLPVYQKEKFTRSAEIDDDSEIRFYEEQNFSPHATHWLLTAITGPDFIDINSNNVLDESDYGYWVEFEYGKWSDGYAWRNPAIDYNESQKSKTYSWGVKEIYYLDKIKTRTHTALFIKEDRLDNKSAAIAIHDPQNVNNPKLYQDNFGKNVTIGKNGNYYWTGLYGDLLVTNSLPYNMVGQYDYKMFTDIKKQKSLRLAKIILLKNTDVPQTLIKTNGSEPVSTFSGDISFTESIRKFNINGQYYGEVSNTIVDYSWYGEYYNKIYDVDDISILAANLENDAISVIDFNFDESYPLATSTPNSDAVSKGRLTLDNVAMKGKGGVQLIPSYRFNYQQPATVYNADNIDDWGFNKNDPTTWSLNEIETPIGAKIKIAYESDDYFETAVGALGAFNAGLQFDFYEYNGKLRFKVEKESSNSNDIKFDDIFEIGSTNTDVWMCYKHDYNDWGCKSRTGKIDISDEVVNVVSVSSSYAIFETTLSASNYTSNSNSGLSYLYARMPIGLENHPNMIREEIERGECVEPPGCTNVTDRLGLKYYLYGNKDPKDVKGGGIRVASIEVTDAQLVKSAKRKYFYNEGDFDETQNANNYRSSGITSYAPKDFFQEIPYRTEMPSPGVIYSRVTVKDVDNDNQVNSKTIYKFKTLEKLVESTYNISMGDILNISIPQHDQNTNISVDGESATVERYKYEIENNFAAIGRLISVETQNSNNQILSKTSNEYKSIAEHNQGISEESFNLFKRIFPHYGNSNPLKYIVSTTSKTTFPNVLKSTAVINGSHAIETNSVKFDFNTGQLLESSTTDSKGNEFKTKSVPAYTISEYNSGTYGMGSKVDNLSNKNMLSQQAMSKTYLKVGSVWKETGVGITTWNNFWDYTKNDGTIDNPSSIDEKVWRKHKSFVWNGDLDTDETYLGYTGADDSFVWTVPLDANEIEQTNDEWKNVSTTTQYDHFSMPLELRDINGNHTSTKMCDDNSKVLAESNAAYTEMFYSGAEYVSSNASYFDGQVKSTGQSLVKAHTGLKSIAIGSGQNGFEVTLKSGEHRAGKYKVSVWIEKASHANARININGLTKQFNGEEVFAGEWVLKSHYEELSATAETVYVTSSSGTVYFDDFRLHPIASSMTGYVYNEWDELWYIIGNKGLATKFEYDQTGRLKKTYTEVIDFNGVGTGGFKNSSENNYNYKIQ